MANNITEKIDELIHLLNSFSESSFREIDSGKKITNNIDDFLYEETSELANSIITSDDAIQILKDHGFDIEIKSAFGNIWYPDGVRCFQFEII